MTVKELIAKLEKFEDKNMEVKYPSRTSYGKFIPDEDVEIDTVMRKYVANTYIVIE